MAAWDRLAASDPGLTGLGAAARATVAVAGALAIELGVATALGLPPLVPMMVGAVLALMSAGVSDPTRGAKAVTLLMLPLFLFAGIGVALVVEHHRVLSLVVFVAVMFVAALIRRFGPRYFHGGMVAFIGYFIALFLLLRLDQLPEILLAVVVASAWAMLLSLVLWPVDDAAVLARMIRAFEGRVRGVAAAAAERMAGNRDTLDGALARVTESALIVDGQLGAPGAVPDDATAAAVRAALVDDELAARALADAVRLLAAAGPDLPGEVRSGVDALLEALRTSRFDDVERAVVALGERADGSDGFDGPLPVAVPRPTGSVGHAPPTVAQTVRRLAAAAQGLARGHRELRPADRPGAEFEPAVVLAAGAMPGSAGTIADMLAERTGPWWRRLSLTTRQAVQIAVATGLAVAVGDLLSGQRYYWAVLAAFMAFTGTATAAQTITKAVHRIVGTMLGLLAAIPLVALTGGTPAVAFALLLVSIFCAFALLRISYAGMVFFITLLLGELYSLLGSFTPDLMLLRLAETAVGGAIGTAVALLVLPIRGATVATAARRAVLGALRTLLSDLDGVLRGVAPDADLVASARVLDARLHQLNVVAAPLLRPTPLSADTDRGRRLMIYSSLARHARSLARLGEADGLTARAELAHVVERVVDLVDDLCAAHPCRDPLRAVATTELLSAVDVRDPTVRRFVHELGYLHDALVSLSDAPGAAREHSAPAPALYGRVRAADGGPARAVLTLTDPSGVQQDRVATDGGGRYRLQAAAPGVHLMITTPAGSAVPVAGWVRVGERAGVHDVTLPADEPTARHPLTAEPS